jgi:hypothetical protein
VQIVRFVKMWPPYNVGETAGFSAGLAATLAARGVAVLEGSFAREEEIETAEAIPAPERAVRRAPRKRWATKE